MTRPVLTNGLSLLVLLATTPVAARAQGWTLDAYAGRAIYDAVSANLGTSNGVLGLRYDKPEIGWFHLSAAAPFSADDPVWWATGLGRRTAFGESRFSAGVDLGAHAYGYRDPASSSFGSGGTMHALPFVSVRGTALLVEVTSGLTQHRSSFSNQTQSRTLHDSGARLILRATGSLELATQARYVRAEEGDYTYGGVSALADLGSARIWGSAGRWFSDALPDRSWSVGASLDLGRRIELWASLREESSDPLYWNDARQSWNIGVSHRLGRQVPAAALPAPALISSGRVTLRLPLDQADQAPFVAGDFTGWEPVAMVRSGEFWVANLAVEPGFHHYAFRSADGTWFVPESVPGRRDDGFGGFVAVLAVP